MEQQLRVYGTKWCGDCHRSKRLLDKHKVPYQWIDVEEDPEAQQFVLRVNQGMSRVPTILFADGSILVEPSDRKLAEKLGIPRGVRSS